MATPRPPRSWIGLTARIVGGLLLGLGLSAGSYVILVLAVSMMTASGQDPLRFLVAVFGLIPALLVGMPLGIWIAFRLGERFPGVKPHAKPIGLDD